MPLNWMDTTNLPFTSLLLLERVQLSWLPQYRKVGTDSGLMKELAVALKANPNVEWYLRHKCPEISGFLDEIMPLAARDPTPAQTREAEQHVLKALNGWLVYVIDPAIYDRQPFTGWDSNELLSLTDWRDKVVVDIGAGTGRLSFTVAEQARVVYAVEPVANLRAYMLSKAAKLGIVNFYAVDGLIERIPFADGFSDITMEGHTFPDDAEGHAAATSETERVTKRGGMVIHCPGNNDADNATHAWLTSHSYHWSRFEEPRDGWKRKYWKTV